MNVVPFEDAAVLSYLDRHGNLTGAERTQMLAKLSPATKRLLRQADSRSGFAKRAEKKLSGTSKRVAPNKTNSKKIALHKGSAR